MVLPGNAIFRAVILDFRPRLGNRCKVLPGNAIFRALILDFRPRLGNRCMVLPGNAIFRALILDFRPRLGNRCKEKLKNGLWTASILDFRPRIGNHCSTIVAAKKNGPPASPSSRQFGMARLQHPRRGGREWSLRLRAGDSCHEGGIILSKKPPEWQLPPPLPTAHPAAPRSPRIIP